MCRDLGVVRVWQRVVRLASVDDVPQRAIQRSGDRVFGNGIHAGTSSLDTLAGLPESSVRESP
jgi:hypothetical protein